MGWQAAFTGAMGVAQYSAQGKIGKYNQSVSERNAQVLLGQRDQIEAKAEFDIAQFQKDFKKIEGETRVALATSGVELGTGSAYNIELSNAYEAKLQENLIRYNSQVAANNKQEEANFATIKGQMARQESKLAQINTIASTGSLLYGMKNTG
jgi:histidine ammonia-lyase